MVAMRQILLHIMPGDPGYGSALLGYHYYCWAFIGIAPCTDNPAEYELLKGRRARTVRTPLQRWITPSRAA